MHPVILCVDDQRIALEIRKRVLERAGYTVLTATRAHEALQIFRDNDVDLVLMEQVAHIGDDFVVAAMKKLKPKVAIAIYSADWKACPQHMRFADVFITKLVSVDELLGAIEDLLQARQIAEAA